MRRLDQAAKRAEKALKKHADFGIAYDILKKAVAKFLGDKSCKACGGLCKWR